MFVHFAAQPVDMMILRVRNLSPEQPEHQGLCMAHVSPEMHGFPT